MGFRGLGFLVSGQTNWSGHGCSNRERQRPDLVVPGLRVRAGSELHDFEVALHDSTFGA